MQVDINRKKADYLIRQINEELSGEDFFMQIFFPNRKTYVATIRDSLKHLFEHYQLDATQIGRMLLVADELMNNAVTYGSEEGDINQFRIAIRHQKDATIIAYEIQDTGNNVFSRTSHEMMLLLEKNRETWSDDLKRQRGRGYHMITQICDELTFEDGPKGGLIVKVSTRLENKILED